MVDESPTQGRVVCVGALGGPCPTDVDEVATVDTAGNVVARGGVGVVILLPGPSPEDLSRLKADLKDHDPLVSIAVMENPSPSADQIRRAVEWGRLRRSVRMDERIRRLGGAVAGEFACRPRDELVGGGEAMAGFRNRLRQVAEHDVATLIHGPCGTPLEAAARWLHVSSPRRDAPYVPVDCREGTESQLLLRIFGHVRNAFPGATNPAAAAVGLASGGTLVLDGIDHASRKVQRRIVELLRDGAWRPVGAAQASVSSARVVVTLRQAPLQALVGGSLERTLMDELSGHIVRMPTVADRGEDIPDLVRHHVTQASIRLGRPRPEIDSDTLATLCAARWIGHDRELELVCERMVLHASGGRITPEAVSSWVEPQRPAAQSDGLVCEGGRTLEQIERTVILATLRHNNGHRRRSAAALGIGVRTLGLKLRRWKDAAIVPETI